MHWFSSITHRRSLHGHEHIDRTRKLALIMVIVGVVQLLAWTLFLILGLLKVPFAHKLFQSVSFISAISVWALVLAGLAQVAGSLAQLTASDAHHDAEATRREVGVDFAQVEGDVARLAALQPGEESRKLANEICTRLRM